MKRWSPVVLIVAAGAALACTSLFSPGEASPDGAQSVIKAVRGAAEFTVPAKGYLEALKASPVAVPRVPTGALKVKELVAEGTIVEPGQVVIVFDDTQLTIELRNHRASFRSAERRIDRNSLQSGIESGAIEIMRRVAELELDHASNFGSLDETIFSKLEILETEVQKEEASETILFAEASLLLRGEYYDIEERILDVEKRQVEGKIGRAETSLANLVLKAPIGGLIVYKKNWRGASVAVGDTLWPGNVVMSIVDPDSTALKAFVLEKDSAGLETGVSATVTIDARPDREYQGKVTKVAEVSRPIERGSPVKYAEVLIELDGGEPGLLKPGMKGEARIVTGKVEDTVLLPRSALRGKPEAPYVLIETPEGPRRQSVEVASGDLVRVAIAAGLDGGEAILLGGSDDGAPEGEAPVETPVDAPVETAAAAAAAAGV